MHFFDVPKLGSYMAIELKYPSCLFESSYDEAYKEFLKCREKRADQKVEKEEFDKEQEELKKQKEEDGDEYEAPDKQWPEILEPAFQTEEKKFVVCLDTLGQDREFTQEDRDFAI